jgi:hypothetical protein
MSSLHVPVSCDLPARYTGATHQSCICMAVFVVSERAVPF